MAIRSTYFAIACAVSLLLLSSMACAPQPGETHVDDQHGQDFESGPQSDLARVRESGTLVILVVPHQESVFVKTNLEAGPMKQAGTADDFVGVDIDLMSAFAKRLGVQLEIRPATGPDGMPGYGQLIPALQAGKGDLIASSFSMTPERMTKIDFSTPYFSVYPAVVARADGDITATTDLKTKMPSTVAGSSQHSHLLEFGFTEDQILFVDFQFENYAAVLEHEADFTVQDSSSAERMIAKDPELKIVRPLSDQRDPYGFGAPKGSDLVPELNHFLDELRANGKLEEILAGGHLTLAD